MRIAVVAGPDHGLETVGDRPVLRIGTRAESDVVLTDRTVSRAHCELAVTGDRIRVRDLGSANGTFFEGARVRDVDVSPGAMLRLGETTIRVTTAEETVQVPLSDRDRFGALLGASPRMREAFAILERVAPTDTTVLVTGESGTGKELAAEGLHAESPRADRPFVVFDCGAVPHDLAESALFGHVRGAFTGAVADRPGVFEEADGGTLFLDEIGELPLDLQPKLLRALEKREIRRVGASTARAVDVRIVAATNRSLESEVNAGRFREDLFYRLAVVQVTLPPLRARTEDLPMLVSHFLARFAPPGSKPPSPSPDALAVLAARPWPGNVRELRNVVERAVSLTGQGAFGIAPAGAAAPLPTGETLDLPFEEALDRFQRRYFDEALRKSGGNISAAARDAGVNRKLLQRLLKRWGRDEGE
jgi:DNA-binding NtrC family response regulator